jgi:hypothetical protein
VERAFDCFRHELYTNAELVAAARAQIAELSGAASKA